MHAVCVSQNLHMFLCLSVMINFSKVLSAVNVIVPLLPLSDVRKQYLLTWWNDWCCAHQTLSYFIPEEYAPLTSVANTYWQHTNTYTALRSLSLRSSLRACTSISGIWISTCTALTPSFGYLCRICHLKTVRCSVFSRGLFSVVCEVGLGLRLQAHFFSIWWFWSWVIEESYCCLHSMMMCTR
jgi:hypothetical protein